MSNLLLRNARICNRSLSRLGRSWEVRVESCTLRLKMRIFVVGVGIGIPGGLERLPGAFGRL